MGALIDLAEPFAVERRDPDPMADTWEDLTCAQATLSADIEGFSRRGCRSGLPTGRRAATDRSATMRALHTAREGLHDVSQRCRGLTKQIDLAAKLARRVVDVAVKELDARRSERWANAEINKARKTLEDARAEAVQALQRTRYFVRQADWLQERFPDAELRDVEGLVKLVDRAEIETHDWSLTPGRYVGVAAEEEDEDFDFEEALRSIHIDLKGLNEEASELAEKISRSFDRVESVMRSVVPIKDFAVGIYDGPHATPKPSSKGPIFLGIKNVTEDGRLNFAEVRHVSEAEYPRWTRRVKPQKDDIVFSYEATLHRYARIPEGFDGCLGRRMALVRPDRNKVDPRFLHYYFLSEHWRGKMDAITITGATVNRIPLTIFPETEVSFPGLNEQQKIADILSPYDDLIENNRRRIALLEEAARLLYREWFVHFRFPGHEHVKITNGFPQGWEGLPASEAFQVNPRTPRNADETIAYVPMAALLQSGMVIDRSDLEYREKSTSVRFKNEDTLFARITPCLENGKTGFVQLLASDEVACGSTEFIVLRGRHVSNVFVYLTARQPKFRENAIKSMIGSSGRQRVQPSCFDRYMVPIPPNLMAKQFAEAVEPMFEQIGRLDQQNQKLAQARELLLPRLMNGEIAV